MIRPKMSVVLTLAIVFGCLLVREGMKPSRQFVKIEITKEGTFVSTTEPEAVSEFDPFFVRENCFEKLEK